MSLPATILENKLDPSKTRGFSLLVMGPDVLLTQVLPELGSLTVGRAEDADVRLGDPLASRFHARLHIGAYGTFELEDLGSINKTRVRDVTLTPGNRVAVVPGEAMTIGSTILMVQEARDLSRPRRIWPHVYFEARLEEECARSCDTKAPFAAIRLHVEGGLAPGVVAETLGPGLRLPDMMALYGPDEFEVLLPNTPPELASAIAQDFIERLRARGLPAKTGMASYPRDGRTPELLLAMACERVRGGQPTAATEKDGTVVLLEPAMRRLYDLASRAAVGMINILLVGETGVGKEVMAENIHRLSPRAKAQLLCLNCAALAENLLESELFGHERGAFTGATEAKPGLLETAPGGTVLLDEIGEMPLSMQAKLLRVIETRQVTRVGGIKPRPIDVRFVAATNRNLEVEAAAGRFRRDLYFRLNGITLQIPPLRERRSEIMALAHLFLEKSAKQMGLRTPPSIGPEAEQMLLHYSWPGNIRELRNVIERATLLCVGGEITADCLPGETMAVNEGKSPAIVMASPTNIGVPPAGESERERIVRVLAECAGSQTRAAKALGIARSTLVEKLEAHNIPRPRKPAV